MDSPLRFGVTAQDRAELQVAKQFDMNVMLDRMKDNYFIRRYELDITNMFCGGWGCVLRFKNWKELGSKPVMKMSIIKHNRGYGKFMHEVAVLEDLASKRQRFTPALINDEGQPWHGIVRYCIDGENPSLILYLSWMVMEGYEQSIFDSIVAKAQTSPRDEISKVIENSVKAAENLLKALHHYGYAHMDANINNVMVVSMPDGKVQVRLIDLERARKILENETLQRYPFTFSGSTDKFHALDDISYFVFNLNTTLAVKKMKMKGVYRADPPDLEHYVDILIRNFENPALYSWIYVQGQNPVPEQTWTEMTTAAWQLVN